MTALAGFLTAGSSVQAGGVPVIDVTSIVQQIQQVLNQVRDAATQAQQIQKQVETIQEIAEGNVLREINNRYLGFGGEVFYDVSGLDYQDIIELLLESAREIPDEELERMRESYGTIDKETHEDAKPEEVYKKHEELEKNIGHYNTDIVEATLEKSDQIQGRLDTLARQLNVADDLAEIEKLRGAADHYHYQSQFLYNQENLRYKQIMSEFVLSKSFQSKEAERIKERHNYMDKESQNRYKDNYENTTIKEQQERFGLNELEDE